MRNRSEQPQKRDGWKTAFWALVIVLVGAIVIVGAQALMPVKQTASSGSSVASNNSFDVSLNKDQLNSLSNFYLNKVQKNQKMKYEFTVNDEAVLGGSTKILGANVNFALALQPVVLKNGNVRLDANRLSVGSLRLPISFVMNYAAKNYKFPEWIRLDSKKKTITLDLNNMNKSKGLSYKAKKIDMTGDGQFAFQVNIPKSGKIGGF